MLFTADMTVAEALAAHPRAAEVFAAFGLGGCAMCHVAEYEKLDDVCEGYGLGLDAMLVALNQLEVGNGNI